MCATNELREVVYTLFLFFYKTLGDKKYHLYVRWLVSSVQVENLVDCDTGRTARFYSVRLFDGGGGGCCSGCKWGVRSARMQKCKAPSPCRPFFAWKVFSLDSLHLFQSRLSLCKVVACDSPAAVTLKSGSSSYRVFARLLGERVVSSPISETFACIKFDETERCERGRKKKKKKRERVDFSRHSVICNCYYFSLYCLQLCIIFSPLAALFVYSSAPFIITLTHAPIKLLLLWLWLNVRTQRETHSEERHICTLQRKWNCSPLARFMKQEIKWIECCFTFFSFRRLSSLPLSTKKGRLSDLPLSLSPLWVVVVFHLRSLYCSLLKDSNNESKKREREREGEEEKFARCEPHFHCLLHPYWSSASLEHHILTHTNSLTHIHAHVA